MTSFDLMWNTTDDVAIIALVTPHSLLWQLVEVEHTNLSPSQRCYSLAVYRTLAYLLTPEQLAAWDASRAQGLSVLQVLQLHPQLLPQAQLNASTLIQPTIVPFRTSQPTPPVLRLSSPLPSGT